MILDLKNTDFVDHISKVKNINNGQNKKVYVFTFGCQQNEADSEKILGMAEQMGYSKTCNAEDADLIILNTCAIRQHAEEKALSMLGMFKALKKSDPDLIIGVCGCMAAESHIKDMLKTDFHYVDFTLEPNMLHKLPYAIYTAIEKNKRTFIFGEDNGDIAEGIPTVRMSKHKAWVSIMYGCNNFCSYCIVPYVRGRERSRSSHEIISECTELVANGCKEITLLGQNVNSYKGEYDFPTLLDKIARIDGDFIIRFMTSHPKDVSVRLVEVMKEHTPKIAAYFHLPLQSGSNKILKKMNRTYDRDKFIEIAELLRREIPNIALSTDVIIGFPGESDDDFNDTMDVLERIRFDNVYSFKYSERVGTPAASMSDAVDDAVKNERMARLLKSQDKVSLERNERYIGRTVRVLVDSVSKRKGFNTVSARTNSGKLVHFEADESAIGKFINVKIEKAGAFDLIGKEIN